MSVVDIWFHQARYAKKQQGLRSTFEIGVKKLIEILMRTAERVLKGAKKAVLVFFLLFAKRKHQLCQLRLSLDFLGRS